MVQRCREGALAPGTKPQQEERRGKKQNEGKKKNGKKGKEREMGGVTSNADSRVC